MKNSRERQRGFLLEVPLILTVVAILLIIAVPQLPEPFGGMLAAVGAMVLIAGLYYLIVIPGWRPTAEQQSGKAVILAKFVGAAGLVIFAVCMYLFD